MRIEINPVEGSDPIVKEFSLVLTGKKRSLARQWGLSRFYGEGVEIGRARCTSTGRERWELRTPDGEWKLSSDLPYIYDLLKDLFKRFNPQEVNFETALIVGLGIHLLSEHRVEVGGLHFYLNDSWLIVTTQAALRRARTLAEGLPIFSDLEKVVTFFD